MESFFIKKNIRNTVLLLIIVLTIFMHLPHFSKELMRIHVLRQTQTKATINNLYEEDMNILNPRRDNAISRGDRGSGGSVWVVRLNVKVFFYL